MKRNLILFTSWLNAEPGRKKLVTTGIFVGLTLIAVIVPGASAVAGPATGGSGG